MPTRQGGIAYPTNRIYIREAQEWIAAMKRAAKLEGMSLSAWVRRTLRREARAVLLANGERLDG